MALSVVGAALLNILGVFVTVPIFLALGGSGSGGVGFETIGKIMVLLILPFAIGQAVQGLTGPFVARHGPRIVWVDRFAISAAIYVAFSGAVEPAIWARGWPAGRSGWNGPTVPLFFSPERRKALLWVLPSRPFCFRRRKLDSS